jgi:hypothetical protein
MVMGLAMLLLVVIGMLIAIEANPSLFLVRPQVPVLILIQPCRALLLTVSTKYNIRFSQVTTSSVSTYNQIIKTIAINIASTRN